MKISKVAVFGTAKDGKKVVTELPESLKDSLLALQKHIEVLVGDCQGIDVLVQKFLIENCPDRKVSVYYSFPENADLDETKPRNYLGDNNPNWQSVGIPVPSFYKSRAFYTQKDIAMCEDADFGIAVWDGKSKGTERNIVQLKFNGKSVDIIRI